jgi:hypothetical protein
MEGSNAVGAAETGVACRCDAAAGQTCWGQRYVTGVRDMAGEQGAQGLSRMPNIARLDTAKDLERSPTASIAHVRLVVRRQDELGGQREQNKEQCEPVWELRMLGGLSRLEAPEARTGLVACVRASNLLRQLGDADDTKRVCCRVEARSGNFG